jgi:hypothetical protein
LGNYKWEEKIEERETLKVEDAILHKVAIEKLKREFDEHCALVHFLAEYDPAGQSPLVLDDPFKYPSCPGDVVITPARNAVLGRVFVFHGQGIDPLSDQIYIRDIMRDWSPRLGPLITKEVFFSPSEVVAGVELINAPGAGSVMELSVLKDALDDADRVVVITTSTGINDDSDLHDLLREHVLDRVYREEVDIVCVVNQELFNKRSSRMMLEEESTLLEFTTNTKISTKTFINNNVRAYYKAQVSKYGKDSVMDLLIQRRLKRLIENSEKNHVVVSPVLYMSLLTNEDT